MKFSAAAETDVGTSKDTNQDSACVKIAETPKGQVAMAVICDGMGGLSKGELASATVIRAFNDWFLNSLPELMEDFSWERAKEEWQQLIKKLNRTIGDYGKFYELSLGTTVTALLLFDGRCLIAHVGDSRVYRINGGFSQLTDDHSIVGAEVRSGRLTPEAAERDPRRNVLTQCVGASRIVMPQLLLDEAEAGDSFLLCSDGFRHTLYPNEIYGKIAVGGEEDMQQSLRELIDMAKYRGETDNISALLIHIKV